jgi:hypothetical protein
MNERIITTGKTAIAVLPNLCRVPNTSEHDHYKLCRVPCKKNMAKIKNTAKPGERTRQKNQHGKGPKKNTTKR